MVEMGERSADLVSRENRKAPNEFQGQRPPLAAGEPEHGRGNVHDRPDREGALTPALPERLGELAPNAITLGAPLGYLL